jgi:hypothetical protein
MKGRDRPQLRVAGFQQVSAAGKMFQHSTQPKNEAKVPRAKCVVVIYETPAIREHAVRFCERLAEERKSAAMEMNWWSFQLLSHPALRGDAVEKAAGADVVVFAMNSGGDLPEEIKWWIEHWLNKRGEREGALVGLLQREEPRDVASFREIYLRHAARRAGMDYLSHAAPTAMRAIPDSIDSFSERAGRMTSVLANILHKHPHHPPRL